MEAIQVRPPEQFEWEYESGILPAGGTVASWNDYRTEVVYDDSYWDVEGWADWCGSLAEPNVGWKDAYKVRCGDDVPERISELRRDGYTVIPVKFGDYGSQGCELEECDRTMATGFYYVDDLTIAREFGTEPDPRKAARRCLRGELETLGLIYKGEVFGYTTYGPGDEVEDSCWGLVGEDHACREADASLRYYGDACPVCRRKKQALGMPCWVCGGTGTLYGVEQTGWVQLEVA
jgi:hypothetical protein